LLAVAFTLVYGVLVGSYFGVAPPDDSWLSRIAVIDLNNQGGMMMLSIAIGIIHLVWANLVMAWRQRGAATALRPLGWATAMVGAYLWGVGEMGGLAEQTGQVLGRVGQWLFIAGVAAVLLFASQRPLFTFRPMQWLGRMFDGVKDLMRASSAFGDVLSYLRLFALGMSSAMLAATFNSLARGASDNEGLGTLYALIILLCGHGLNLLMCVMSGVVHGLRLNCIEFFNWGLPEEGYLFRAFAKKARP
jgi:V/A-type H+-transporting ATPase subunit I